MMAKTAEFEMKVVANRTMEISERAHERLGMVVTKTTMDIEADAKMGVTEHDLIDTGFLLGSVQGIPHPADLWGEIIVGAAYGIHHELGAPAINLPARPFMGPAAENNFPDFEAAVAYVLKQEEG